MAYIQSLHKAVTMNKMPSLLLVSGASLQRLFTSSSRLYHIKKRSNFHNRFLVTSITRNNLKQQQQQQRVAYLSSSSSSQPVQENPFMKRSADGATVNTATAATASTTTTTAAAAAVEEELTPIALDNSIRLKNAALATTLLLFCFGVAYYSMHAVGQAGTSTTATDGSSEITGDPLAVLKAEAAIAQEKINKEQATTATTVDMLSKFEKGEYDPDHISDDELDNLEIEERSSKKKKPWWKFW